VVDIAETLAEGAVDPSVPGQDPSPGGPRRACGGTAGVWSDRLPERYREIGPHIEYMPAGTPKLVGASYVEEPGTEGPDVAWWCYEDHRASLKRPSPRGIRSCRSPAPRGRLRGDAAGMLEGTGTCGRHGLERGRGAALFSELIRASAANSSSSGRTRSSRCSA